MSDSPATILLGDIRQLIDDSRHRAAVAIELKLGHFKPADKGQVELYLRWLSRYERREGEGEPIGLILCAKKNEQVVELLELNDGSLRVASYLTELPPRELLERKLLDSIALAKARAVDTLALTHRVREDESDG